MKLYININAPCSGCGTQENPFRTIQEAAQIAQPYENPDGSPIRFDRDYFGQTRATVLPGPFAEAAAAEKQL